MTHSTLLVTRKGWRRHPAASPSHTPLGTPVHAIEHRDALRAEQPHDEAPAGLRLAVVMHTRRGRMRTEAKDECNRRTSAPKRVNPHLNFDAMYFFALNSMLMVAVDATRSAQDASLKRAVFFCLPPKHDMLQIIN